MIAVTIPHGRPVRCVADTAEPMTDGISIRARVAADSPGVTAGMVQPGWLIEVAAQACAACAGVAQGGVPRAGLLIGVRNWRWNEPVPAERDLVVEVARAAAFGSLLEYRCAIHHDGRVVATGSLQVAIR